MSVRFSLIGTLLFFRAMESCFMLVGKGRREPNGAVFLH